MIGEGEDRVDWERERIVVRIGERRKDGSDLGSRGLIGGADGGRRRLWIRYCGWREGGSRLG